MRFPVLLALALLQVAPPVFGDSPSADEFPFWPTSVLWNPKSPVRACSRNDSANPHGSATWDAQFTQCVNTLAYFDTCSDDACVDAFDAATTKALNCSYDGKIGTAREVESNRLQRCVAARRVESERYIPEVTPSAPQCTSAQLTTWDVTYKTSTDYNSCLKSLTLSSDKRSCSEYCRRVFHDAVSDAGECLFSPKAGSVTHHEWLKYLLVWCIQARGETLRADPLLYVKGTSRPSPTTAKPTKTPSPTPTANSSGSSSSSGDVKTPKPTKKPKRNTTTSSDGSHASQADDTSVGSGPLLDLAASQGEESTQFPVVVPPAPQRPSYGRKTTNAAVTPTSHVVAIVVATSIALVQFL
jgi:hypothetical protein